MACTLLLFVVVFAPLAFALKSYLRSTDLCTDSDSESYLEPLTGFLLFGDQHILMSQSLMSILVVKRFYQHSFSRTVSSDATC